MKITLDEYDAAVYLDLEPETLKDAALLVRIGMNATTKADVRTYAFRKSGISTSIVVEKRKRGRITV